MTERIRRKITAIILALVMTLGLMPTMTMTAYGDTTTSISLVASENFTFTAATEGYDEQAAYQVWIKNEGPGDTGALTVSLGESNPAAFEIFESDVMDNIPNTETRGFKVRPMEGLGAGTYTTEVTVSGSNVASKSFRVSFTVSPAGTTYKATIHINLDGSPVDATGDVELHKGLEVIPVDRVADGVYETEAPNGDYTIFINDVSVGRHIEVSGEDKSVTLDYFTVNFSASHEGTATGSSIGASVDGTSINSGDQVLYGKTIAITATGSGAGSYTYSWSGVGTNGETTATLSFIVRSTVNAVCVVTGSGTPPSDADYKINDTEYNWTGTAQTVVLSDDNNTLTINKAPTAAVRIEIQKDDGSEVTIEGNSIECANTTMVVFNAITLNLSNLRITAPGGSMEDWRLFTGLLLNKTTTVNVTGTCNISGNANSSRPWYGYGIASEQDNTLHITGSGTLNATGGDANTGNGGAGIYIVTDNYGTESGSRLIIDGGITVNAKGGGSPNNQAGSAILAGWGDIAIDHATVTAIGGTATGSVGGGGSGIQAFSSNSGETGNITINHSSVTAAGGASAASNGGRGIDAFTDVTITGGMVIATGGNGDDNGAHGVFAYRGAITVADGADLRAVGGNGTRNLGGVGMRAYGGTDIVKATPGIITIPETAGDVYIRGGQGKTAQRPAVMGKGIYIAAGNIGPVAMESGISRLIKNSVGGDDLYLVNAATTPAEAVEIQCEVTGPHAGTYTYHAVANADGTASLWLPEGAQTLSATAYEAAGLTVAADDASNTAALSKPAVVTAHNSTELSTYMAAGYVTTINLVSGTTYTYNGAKVERTLTINGNGATINVGTGVGDEIVKRERTIEGTIVKDKVDGTVFMKVESGSLTIKDVTLRDISTRILAVLNVKTGGTLLLDNVSFEGFFANLGGDAYPDSSNIPGSYNNFGVHAEPGAVSTTVKNCTFGSSNTFRNAVAIRRGTAVITDNTFVGTATPERQNQTDGFEYGVYLYGGNCTVTGNDFSGYDSILKLLGYHSAGISLCPYYDLTTTITGNRLHDNARGIDAIGAWHTYSDPAEVNLNGTVLNSSDNAFLIGQALKAANTFSGNEDGNIAMILDQNDNYIDEHGTEYGPPAYFEPLLKPGSTSSTGATLNFDTGTWARAMVSNAKTIGMQVSEDNGTTWRAASVVGTIGSSATSVTVNLGAGKTYLLRSVMVITANTRPVGSLDDVSADITCYSNTVSVTIPSVRDTSSSDGASNGAPGGAAVIVNGESITAGTSNTSTAPDGKKTTTVTVDSGKLETILASKESGATVIIPVVGKTDSAAGVLTGEMVKNMENRQAILVIKTDSATYTLPAAEIDITAISKQLGTNIGLKDIAVEVSISTPSSQMSTAVESAAKNTGFTPVLAAVEYTVTCSYGGRTVEASSFNAYVERTVAIPAGVDPSKITTGIVVKPDGTSYHVPTRVTVIEGKYYAVINSLTNSTYSVVWHPIEFADVNNHWAKAAVNNMGSRMVIDGVGNGSYEPDRDMTRAEFATAIVKALGLEPGKGAESFADVPSNTWYSGYVKTAAAYGIIKGYSDTAFGPEDKITREQAMTMLARAMKITGLNTGLTSSERDKLIGAYTDSSAVASFANDSVGQCIKTGVVSGRGNNLLAPKAYVTRAEVAAMIERLLQKSSLI